MDKILNRDRRIMNTFIEKLDDGTLLSSRKTYRDDELAEILNVSREEMPSVLRMMQVFGFVTEHNGGDFVVNSPAELDSSLFPLEIILSFWRSSSQDLYELRKALEIENAVNAAQRATDEEIQEIQSLSHEMEQTDFAEQSFEQVHRRFHLHIAACSGNIISYHLLSSVMTLIQQQIADTYAQLSDNDKETVSRSHRDICRALMERRSELVQELMRQHMNFEPLNEMMHHS